MKEVIYPVIVDGHGRVKVKTNWYSAPLSPGGVRPRGGAIADRDQARQPMCGPAPALLRARSSDSQPGTLSGRVGEEARRHGRIDAAGAMASGRPLAGVSGSDLEKLEERLGKSGGTREMITLVRAG